MPAPKATVGITLRITDQALAQWAEEFGIEPTREAVTEDIGRYITTIVQGQLNDVLSYPGIMVSARASRARKTAHRAT